jgi:hypothetical protein
MSDDLDAILRRVAAGELTPEQAIPLIDAARAASEPEWGTPPPTPPGAPGAPETPATGPFTGAFFKGAGGERPRAVRIAVSYRSVDVVADPGVDTVTVSDGNTVRREGDVLVVESLQLPGFTEFEGGQRDSGGAWSFLGLPRTVAWAGSIKGGHMTVRVNPTLPLEIDSAAASVRISGCEGGARVRLVAASLKVDRLRGPLELEALTSSVKGTAAITGTSKISCESSSVKLSLLTGSNVRATTTASRLGKVVLPGAPNAGPHGRPESVIGAGEGTLQIDGVMSSIMLSSDETRYQASA